MNFTRISQCFSPALKRTGWQGEMELGISLPRVSFALVNYFSLRAGLVNGPYPSTCQKNPDGIFLSNFSLLEPGPSPAGKFYCILEASLRLSQAGCITLILVHTEPLIHQLLFRFFGHNSGSKSIFICESLL